MTVLELADYVVRFYNRTGDSVSNKKLNKVLYYIQGWHFAYFNGDAIFHEVPQAWVHGPVYPDVYHKYKMDNDIRVNEKMYSPDVMDEMLNRFQLSQDQKDFLQSSLIHYSKKSGAELEILTHRERPWLETRGDLAPHVGTDRSISLELIKDYFTQRLQSIKR